MYQTLYNVDKETVNKILIKLVQRKIHKNSGLHEKE